MLITNERFNIDEETGKVWVYGQLENLSASAFRQVEVHAILLSAARDKRGENSVKLQNIKPGEKRIFSLTATSHGRVASVDLEIAAPGPP